MKKHDVKLLSIILNSVAIITVCAILIGATFAWFTDSAISSGNKIRAGSLKVDLELLDTAGGWSSIKNDNTPIFNNDKWEPGYTEIKILKIENEGTLALKWKTTLVPQGGISKLADVIDVYVLPSNTELTYPESRTLDGYYYAGTLTEFIEALETNTKGTLLGGESAYLGIALKMRQDAGNEYQGLDLGGNIDVVISAAQVSSETDSIDAEYDAEAPYPVVICTAQSLKDAMLVKGAKIRLESDIVIDASTPLQYGSYMFLANGREVTIDLNGHDIIIDETTSRKLEFMFTTANKGVLNIVGEGTLVSRNGRSGIFWGMNKNDQINIYGGTFVIEGDSWDNNILYVTSGNIDVYGGTFCYPEGMKCANAQDSQGNRLGIVFHEGALLQSSLYQAGDSARIQLAEGCSIEPVEIDGETWYRVTANN